MMSATSAEWTAGADVATWDCAATPAEAARTAKGPTSLPTSLAVMFELNSSCTDVIMDQRCRSDTSPRGPCDYEDTGASSEMSSPRRNAEAMASVRLDAPIRAKSEIR